MTLKPRRASTLSVSIHVCVVCDVFYVLVLPRHKRAYVFVVYVSTLYAVSGMCEPLSR